MISTITFNDRNPEVDCNYCDIGKREEYRSLHDLLDIKHGKNEQLKKLIKRKNATYTKL